MSRSKNNIETDYSKYTDAGLIDLYKHEQDKYVWAELYKRYTHLLYGLCLKYLKNADDAKDAVMQIFEKLATDLLHHQVDYFKGWLYTVGRNHCLMELRRNQTIKKHEQQYSKTSGEVFMEYQPEMHLNTDSDDTISDAKLNKAIAQLNNEQRKCIELFYLQEKSYKEVADITGFQIKNVKSYIQNGKRNLKNILTNLTSWLLIL